jgi:hypothetical protein
VGVCMVRWGQKRPRGILRDLGCFWAVAMLGEPTVVKVVSKSLYINPR